MLSGLPVLFAFHVLFVTKGVIVPCFFIVIRGIWHNKTPFKVRIDVIVPETQKEYV